MNYNARVTRLRRIATHDRIFFVTTNIVLGRPDLRLAERDVILAVLSEERTRGSFWLFGYVVMPDHAHLLLAPRHCDLDEAMRRIKSLASKRIQEKRHAAGTLWQPRYFDRIVRHARDCWQKLAYIHRNPVEAALVANPHDWRWSSVAAYDVPRTSSPPVPVDPVNLPAESSALLWPGR